MARPRKASADRFSETVSFTLQPAQLVAIRQRAAAAGLSLSEYIRTLLLNGKVVMRKSQALDPDTYDQLRRIGVNLNQAVYRLHMTGRTPAALISAADSVERFLMENLDNGPKGGGQGPEL